MSFPRVIGIDLDGVAIWSPFYNTGKQIARIDEIDMYLYHLSWFKSLRALFYSRVRPNPEIIDLVKELKQRGDRIVIISGHADRCVNELTNCLTKMELPFDHMRLLVAKDYLSYRIFKLKMIIETGCQFYIEDRRRMVRYLRRELNGQCQIFHYQDQNPESLSEIRRVLIN